MTDINRGIFALLVVLLCVNIYIAYKLTRQGEGWEVIVPRSSLTKRELPPNFGVKLTNLGSDTYQVLFPSAAKEKLIDTIFLHRPEDEPMLHYVLRTNVSGVALDTLPASTVANLWLVENMGMCWSSTKAVPLPAPGQTVDLEMTVAFCI